MVHIQNCCSDEVLITLYLVHINQFQLSSSLEFGLALICRNFILFFKIKFSMRFFIFYFVEIKNIANDDG